LAEPVEVVTLTETEPIAPENVTPAVASVSRSFSWKEWADGIFKSILPYLVLGWLIGVFGLSVWHLGGWAQLQRLRRRMVKPVEASLHSKLRELSELLGIHRAVQLMESALVRVPTVVGWLRPVILLPASALTGLSCEQLEALLAHELAHIRRYDYLVNMLQTVVEILGFYHPAVWWVSHKIRVERENCCDDLAVRICGDKVRYAKALTSMEEIRGGRAGLAVAANGVSLLGRIRRLVGKGSRENKRCSWVPAVITLLLILSLAIPTTLALTGQTREKANVEVESESSAESKFTAVLSNGVRVELVGVCEHPSEGKQWWRPDGTAMEKPPYKNVKGDPIRNSNERFNQLREIAVKVAGFDPENVSIKYSVPAAGSTSTNIAGEAGDITSIACELPRFLESHEVRVGAASGSWQTVASQAADFRANSIQETDAGSITWAAPLEVKGEAAISLAHPFVKDNVRIIAEDKEGQVVTAHYREGRGTSIMGAVRLRFPIPLSRVSKFHLQTRPYEWVEFKNVSLKPGVGTDVRVEVRGARAEKEEDEEVLAVLQAMAEEAKKVSDQDKMASEKTRREEIAKRVAALEDHRVRVERDLRAAEDALEDIRRSSGFTDLDEQSHPHAITLRLNDLELARNQLILQVQQLRAKIANLEKQKDGYTDAEVAGDPVVAMLTQELPRREAQLVARLAEFGKGHEKVQKIEEAINVIKKRLATRKAEIAEQVRQAELRKARDQLAVLSERLQELEKMRVEVAAKKRDLDEARVQYKQRLAIRDERRKMLDSIKEQIEKLKIIYDDPEPSPELVRVYEREDERGKAREGRRLSKKEIAAKLKNLSNRRNNVQRDLQVVEHEMEDVRRSSGLTDLEERSYPHPVTSRVIRLERQRDDCILEIAQLKAKIDNLQEKAGTAEGKANLEKAHDDLVVLTRKLEQLQVMREEAAAKKRDLDLARVQYKQRLAIRDERKRMLDSLKSEIEKLKILHDDPETPETKTEDKKRF
jgi:beta-lactamase regulating signal transducer with metallopeptidase domain